MDGARSVSYLILLFFTFSVLGCGGIGGGAQAALQAQNIRLCGGVSGLADEASAAFAAGNLVYQDAANRDHHAHGAGGCGHHHA